VRTVVTDLCTLRRESELGGWSVADVYPSLGGLPVGAALDAIREACPWPLTVPEGLEYAPLMSTAERATLHRLDPRGVHFRRSRAPAPMGS